jgi:hypothetical protein
MAVNTRAAGLLLVCAAAHGRAPAPPSILKVHPAAAGVGTTVLIQGKHFLPHALVTFPGAAAQPATLLGRTRLKVTVPPGAATGELIVTTAGGTAQAPFVVLSPPPSLEMAGPGWLMAFRVAAPAPAPGPGRE